MALITIEIVRGGVQAVNLAAWTPELERLSAALYDAIRPELDAIDAKLARAAGGEDAK